MSQVATPRQAQVLALREQGLSVKQIADELSIRPATVKIFVGKLISKGIAHPRPKFGQWNGRRLDALLASMETESKILLASGIADHPARSLDEWVAELRGCKG